MDYRPALRATTGIGRYARELAGALARDGIDLRLFGVFHKGNRKSLRRGPPGARLVAWPVPSRLMDLLGRLGILTADRAVGGCDLFHHTNFILPVVSPGVPRVMTVHDLAFLRAEPFHTEEAKRALRGVMECAVRECRAFLVPSEATARDCAGCLRIPRERIFVTPLGVSPDFFDPAPAAREEPYLLAVGTLEPRKNFRRLIRAAQRAGDLPLLIAGGRGWLSEDVRREAEGGRARLLGHVPEARLRALVSGATAVLYPSLLEGFGLPVLEAMAMGKAVLTSDRPPLSDLAGGAALLVDPESEDSIEGGIRRLVSDEPFRRALGERARERAREFTWERCARETRRAYEAALT
jgi:glycosyltransferase involved in cell wall biosynthesis